MCDDHFEGSVALKDHVIQCKEENLSKLQKKSESKHSSQESIEKVDQNYYTSHPNPTYDIQSWDPNQA